MSLFGRRRNYLSLAVLLISADICLFVFSLFMGGIVLLMAAVGLGLFLLALYIYLAIVTYQIRVRRSHSESAVEGEVFFVDMAVANFAWLPIFFLDVRDGFNPGRMLSISRTVRESIMPRTVYEYTASAVVAKKMGQYVLGPVELTVSDPFGIFSRTKVLEHHSELTVYPSIRIPERLFLMEEPIVKRVGEEIIGAAGYAADFRGQREYRRGDPKKNIHWRATAKHDRLIVKEFDENGITDIGIFIDYRRIGLRGTGSLTTLELALNSGAAVAATAARSFHRFMATFIGFRRTDEMVFGTGVHHLHLLLHRMVALGRPGKYSNYCSEVMDKLHVLRRNGTAVLICSQTATDTEEMAALIKACRLQGLRPVVILIDDRTFIKVYPEQMDLENDAVAFDNTKRLFEESGALVFGLSKRDIPARIIDSSLEQRSWARNRGKAQ